MTTVRVKQLFTYPIKGLTPQAETQVSLRAGHGIPGDRAFALMYDSEKTDDNNQVVPWMKSKTLPCNVTGQG